MGNLLVQVINLKGSELRLASVADGLREAGLPWTRFEAVDFRRQRPQDHPQYKAGACEIRHDGPLTGGEMGCALSHLGCLESFLNTKSEFTLILEDDARVPTSARALLDELLEGLEARTGSNWDSVYLALTARGYDRFAFDLGDCKVLRSSFVPCGTPAILWSRQGAQRFLASKYGKQVGGPIDREFRSYHARAGKAYKLAPPPFSRHGFESDIGASGARFGPGARPSKSSVRSRILRHFPDYFFARANTWLWSTGLR